MIDGAMNDRRASRFGVAALALALALAMAMALGAAGAVGAATESDAAVTDVAGPSEDYYEDALARVESHDYEGAIIQLKNALNEDRGNLPARILLGRAYLGVGDGVSAEKELARARTAGADDELIIVSEAQALLLQLKFEALLNRVRSAERGPSLEAAVLVARGEAHLGLSQLIDAETSFAAARRLDPGLSGAHLGLGKIHFQRGQLDRAAEFANTALEVTPRNINALYVLGEIARIQRHFDDALDAFGQALEIEPYHIDSRLSRAAIYIDTGRFAEARPDTEFVLDTIPNNAHAAYLLSLLLTGLGDSEGADTALRFADRLVRVRDPMAQRTHGPTMLLGGAISYARGNIDEAYARLDDYIRLDPVHPGARKLLAAISLPQDSPGLAIEYLRPALGVTPDDPHLLRLLGRALMMDRRFSEAAEVLERVAQFADDESIRADIALNMLAAGRRDEAVASLKEGMENSEGGGPRASCSASSICAIAITTTLWTSPNA